MSLRLFLQVLVSAAHTDAELAAETVQEVLSAFGASRRRRRPSPTVASPLPKLTSDLLLRTNTC